MVYRICRAVYTSEAWTGEGAWRYGARWNSRHVRVVYTSASLALAAMEFFVHLEPNLAPRDLCACAGELPQAVAVADLEAALPHGWESSRPEALRRLGDRWVQAASTVALRVPSAVIPGEWNILLNPAHPDFEQFPPHPPRPFAFDGRLFRH